MDRDKTAELAPCILGGEAEFFLQKAMPHTVACHAHLHSVLEMLYVKSGSYTVLLNDTEHMINAGDLILFCSNVSHYALAGADSENSYYVLKIPPSFLLETWGCDQRAEYVMRFVAAGPDSKFIWRKDELTDTPIQRVLDGLIREYEIRGYAYEVAIKLKMTELLFEILRENPMGESHSSLQVTRLIYDAILYIGEHFSEDINERELASTLGLSYSYFSRCFKRVTGITFKQHLNRERVNRAEQMLVMGNGSVTEIATECGYNSVSYFINTYRSIKGKTPYETARAMRQSNG